jgi:hypothetical protein
MMLLQTHFENDDEFAPGAITDDQLGQVQAAVEKRWKYLHADIHAVAALLSPRNWADEKNDWSSLRECVFFTRFFLGGF